MKKPLCKLSSILKVLWVVVLVSMALLLLEGLLVDAGRATLSEMVWVAAGATIFLASIYLAVEFIGVARGHIEDDVGVPPPSNGGRLPALLAHLRVAKRTRDA
ncbi:MAG: hypothetical protein BroJett038_24500 [Chloroflexota bacterium]|nr:MAG: hypothetical protein BroJett038_24500 [Chloroflexota bacterium]